MSLLRKYGMATEILFPLISSGSTQFTSGSTGYTPVEGDVKISKDFGAAQNTNALPSYHWMGNGVLWKLSLTASEMQANLVAITVIDASPKAVEDQSILIETYGTSGSGNLNLSDFADEYLKRDFKSVTGEASFSALNAHRANRYFDTSGSTYTVRKEDGVTGAWTAHLLLSTSGSPVTGVTT